MVQLYRHEEEKIKEYIEKYETKGYFEDLGCELDPTSKNQQFYKMKSDHQVPYLIVFINSFINELLNPQIGKVYFMLSQFYQVFSYFAELGPTARHYLLKLKMVGRLMDMFFDKQSKFNEVFRDNSDIPIFKTQKELYLGYHK